MEIGIDGVVRGIAEADSREDDKEEHKCCK